MEKNISMQTVVRVNSDHTLYGIIKKYANQISGFQTDIEILKLTEGLQYISFDKKGYIESVIPVTPDVDKFIPSKGMYIYRNEEEKPKLRKPANTIQYHPLFKRLFEEFFIDYKIEGDEKVHRYFINDVRRFPRIKCVKEDYAEIIVPNTKGICDKIRSTNENKTIEWVNRTGMWTRNFLNYVNGVKSDGSKVESKANSSKS